MDSMTLDLPGGSALVVNGPSGEVEDDGDITLHPVIDLPRGANWEDDRDPAATRALFARLDATKEGLPSDMVFWEAISADGANWQANEMHCAALYGVAVAEQTRDAIPARWRDMAEKCLTAA